MPIPLVVSITGDTRGLEKSLDSAGGSAQTFGQRFNAGAILKVAAFAGVATIAVDGLLQLGKAAADDAREAASLELAIRNAGAATGDWSVQVDNAIARGQELAFTDTQIREAMTTLVAATGSVTEATGGLALAQDLARLKGIDLATAADAVAKAEGGSATSLAKLLKLSTEGKDATDILAEAQRLAAGQAELYGDSQAGAADRAGIKLAELGEKVGTLVLPVLEFLTDALEWLVDLIDSIATEHGPAFNRGVAKVGDAIAAFFRGVDKVRGFIDWFIGRIRAAIDAVADLIDKLADLNPFAEKVTKNIGRFNGGTGGPGAGGEWPGGLGPGATGGSAGSIDNRTVTITLVSNDPDAMVRALARWAGRNGGAAAFLRTIDR